MLVIPKDSTISHPFPKIMISLYNLEASLKFRSIWSTNWTSFVKASKRSKLFGSSKRQD